MILNKLFGIETRSSRIVTGAGVGQDAALKMFGAGAMTTAGIAVDEATAQSFSAVYRAVTLISSTIASLPFVVHRRVGEEGDKEIARKHPVFRLVHRRPNPTMTAFFYRQAAMAYVLLWGRHFSYIQRSGRGEIVGLWPMRTQDVGRTRLNGSLVYDISRVKDNELFPKPPIDRPILQAQEVLEWTTFDGESILSHAREQIGEALAAQQFGGGFYAGGAQPYMVITSPSKIKEPEEFRRRWEAVHGGAKRRLAVLEGMDIKTVGMPLDDAQFLESRKFYVTEIARWFGVPPHKLMDLERATFSNIEEQQLEWYEGLLPWLAMIEQEGDRQLLTESESDAYYLEHNIDGLLRGNIVARYGAYSTGIQWGILNRNEVRRRENMNSMGKIGDVFLVPGNMTTADKAGEQLKPEAPTEKNEEIEDVDEQRTLQTAARRTLVQAISRMRRKEAAEVRAAAKKPDRFLEWLEEYRTKWPAKWQAGIGPAAEVCRAVGLGADAARIEVHCRAMADGLLELSGAATPNDFAGRVEKELSVDAALCEQIANNLLQ